MKNKIYIALHLEVFNGFFSILNMWRWKIGPFALGHMGYVRAWKTEFPEHLKLFGPLTELGRENAVNNEADRWKHSWL